MVIKSFLFFKIENLLRRWTWGTQGKKKKNYFPFFSYINLVYLSLRFTKIQIHAPKIYKTNRHWTWFSYALKPNTKTQTQIFSTHMQSNTKHNTYFPIFSENLKNNEQNPIFSQTHLYSICGKVGSAVWVCIFWIFGDIGQWQHKSAAWVGEVWWWVGSNVDLMVGWSERGIERVLRLTWESFYLFVYLFARTTWERV